MTGPGIVILTWKKASCKEGISHYRVYLDENLIGNTLEDTANYTVNNLPLYTELCFKVIAVTNNLRVSKESNIACITLPTGGEPHYLNYNLNFYI